MSLLTLHFMARDRQDRRPFPAAAIADELTKRGLEKAIAELESDRVVMGRLAGRSRAALGAGRYQALVAAIDATIEALRAELDERRSKLRAV